MDCIIYMDLFFLLNFWMNALVLFLLRMITKTYRTLWCLVAALFGAIGSCIVTAWYIMSEEEAIFLPALFIMVIIINLMAFGKKSLIWHSFLYIAAGMLLAGIWYFLAPFCLSCELAIGMVSCTAVFFCILLERQCRIRWKEEHMKAKTILEFGERRLFATALMDTGNRLYDPFYHKPVILVDGKMMKELISDCKCRRPEKIQYIPFQSVGKEHGLLEGIMFDKVSIHWENKTWQFADVIAASTTENLYRGKDYQVIFHCGLLQEE